MMAGTNDFFFHNQGPHGGNATQAVARMTKLLDICFAALPKVTVLLSAVTRINVTLCNNYSSAPWHPPNCPKDMPLNIKTYNEQMVSVVASQHAAGRRIFYHDVNCNRTVRKRVVLRHLYIKMIVLPRQARDKHRENSKKDAFRQDGQACTDSDPSTWADGDYFTWGIHFSFSGYAKMAAHWMQALLPHLPPFPPPGADAAATAERAQANNDAAASSFYGMV
jgi:hypothetical protein